MRSPRERALWTALAVALAAAAGAAWWTADQWLPHAGPWLERAWRSTTRPGHQVCPPFQSNWNFSGLRLTSSCA